MRAVTLCALAALLTAYAAASPDYVKQFESFKVQYGRKYATADEEASRFKTFVQNMKAAQELQAVNPLATFGVNEFADVSSEEFKATRANGKNVYRKLQHESKHIDTMRFTESQRATTEPKQDWRPKGAVTAVKNQGQCGSCWSFSTTGGIEGQWFLAGNTLTSLSEQELVSCDTIDSGCNGGLMDNAFQWLQTTHNGSIVTEASYPYVSGGGSVPACDMSGKKFGAQIDGFANVQKDDMTAFVSANGPLSIAVYAMPWQSYTGGILTNCPQEQIDHGVLIVGYDDTNTPPYWIIKNSWGPAWGEQGYIRVQKGQSLCNIGAYQTSSKVKKAGPTPAPGPTPPTPPTPPASGDFVQKVCKDAMCANCQTQTFKQGQCIQRAHASYIATCDTNALLVKEYASTDCSGAYREQSQALDVCAVVFGAFDAEVFVQASCSSSPAPPSPPSPPSPTPPAPTTTPAPAATFEQKQCANSACTEGCSSHTFPQNTCLALSGGGSAKAVCTTAALELTVFMSGDCSGSGQTQSQPINTCEQDEQGTYFENVCGEGKFSATFETTGLKRRH